MDHANPRSRLWKWSLPSCDPAAPRLRQAPAFTRWADWRLAPRLALSQAGTMAVISLYANLPWGLTLVLIASAAAAVFASVYARPFLHARLGWHWYYGIDRQGLWIGQGRWRRVRLCAWAKAGKVRARLYHWRGLPAILIRTERAKAYLLVYEPEDRQVVLEQILPALEALGGD